MALPNWRIEIVKQLDGEVWSNDYLTALVTIDAAADIADELVAWEQQVHASVVTILYALVSTTIKGDRTFRHITYNVPGIPNIGEYLPLFNTIRVDLQTEDSDPGRKYYRQPIPENGQANGYLVPGTVASFNAAIASTLQPIIDNSALVTPKGNQITGATTFPKVQIRQLHRRRRKKVTP